MKNIDMDLTAANSNDYIHADGSLQFKRERRKVGKHLLNTATDSIIMIPEV